MFSEWKEWYRHEGKDCEQCPFCYPFRIAIHHTVEWVKNCTENHLPPAHAIVLPDPVAHDAVVLDDPVADPVAEAVAPDEFGVDVIV